MNDSRPSRGSSSLSWGSSKLNDSNFDLCCLEDGVFVEAITRRLALDVIIVRPAMASLGWPEGVFADARDRFRALMCWNCLLYLHDRSFDVEQPDVFRQ